jgi:uncharacterized SAM-dependent methyltransferase
MPRNVSQYSLAQFRAIRVLNDYSLDHHDAFYRSRVAQTVRDPLTQVDFTFLADELIHIEVSYKVISIELYHDIP